MKKCFLILALLLLTTNISPNTALANKAGVFHIGAQVGGVFPSDNLRSRIGFGARFGYGLMDEWSLGFSYLYSSSDFGTNGIVSFSLMEFLLDSYYHCEGWRFGAKFGLVRFGASVVGFPISASTSDFAAGPAIGYDWSIPGADGLTIGPEVSVPFVFASGTTVTIFDALLTIKYSFL